MARKKPGPAAEACGVHAASTSYRKPAVKRDESRAPQTIAPELGRVSPLRAAASPTDSGAHGVTRPTKPSALLDTRVIYCGDNLEQLQKLPDACVDLIYIDPPFNSNRNYEVFWGETKEKRAFEDRHASTQAYIDYMRPRCVELGRVLKKTGSFYYHCDWHASHYVKVMLDQILGENNFENEIIWKRYGAHSNSKGYGAVHDVILYYGGGEKLTFHREFEPYDPKYVEDRFRYQDPDGRRWAEQNLNNPAVRPNLMYPFTAKNGITYACPDNGWKFTKERMAILDAENRLHYPKKEGGRLRMKSYLDEMPGVSISDVWTDISVIGGTSPERLG
ncbi:MAG: site-specific DNA-methyltransferase [Verrucomicrobia bacterium]|nr:site-specific DNA-methyltransferase [Verrucomicrobiota bacterium]